ncbi:uncharacterized protein N7482_003690 [Penicillium canariense]|uniref:Uncharacterized protein n=1 Tax=Penicillium canariense TaxID=189055 RepID=A0A9W9I565_9EURO|nr:uncharacterized protein N7482_003690 [Penicillium canariense]KAJ5168096.1 hypothetical protein N7482_003690 [Penicillium canariense]
MSQLGDNQSPGPNGHDAMVDQLMRQPESFTSDPAPVNEPEPRQESQEAQQLQQPVTMQNPILQVIVPRVHNHSDYKYLPGHFKVRRILHIESSNPEKPVYTVRLASGEREIMTPHRLMRLENSTQALDVFSPETESDDEILMVGSRATARNLSFGGDGAEDGTGDGEWKMVDSGSRILRPRRHISTAPGQYAAFYRTQSSSSSDENQESSSDELNERQPSRRRRLSRRPRRQIPSSNEDEESPAPEPPTRVSTRLRKSVRNNLRERLEDDLSDAEGDAPKQQKYAGAREAFPVLQRDDEFRQRHFACCSTCNYYEDDEVKGPLVFCQGCTSSYHQQCLGPRSSREHLVTKIDEEHFILQCRRCLGVAHSKHDVSPHLGSCAVCKEKGPMSQPLRVRLSSKEEQQQRIANGGTDPITPVDMAQVNSIDNILFRCASCHRAFHIEHLPAKPDHDLTEVFCEYTTHWQCQECSDAPGEIEALAAWRPCNSPFKGSRQPLVEVIPEVEKEYLVKWKQKSYFRTNWMPGDWVWGVSTVAMRRAFFNSPKARNPIWTAEEAIPEENLRIDIVFDVTFPDGTDPEDLNNPELVQEAFVKYKGLNYEDSVWESPPDLNDTARWEDFELAFNDWLYRDTIEPPNRNTLKKHLDSVRRQNFERDLVLETEPELITGGQLMEYQLDGVNWLYYMFMKQQNSILADDMGLGKTIQVIALFATLIQKHQCWPFLVVAPNSTVPNWRREIKKWSPGIRVVTYYGSAFSRQMANDYEMFPQRNRKLRCHVVIASYESMVDEEAKKALSRIHWGGLVVDEGQRLKNDKSQLYDRLCRMKFDFKVLLTGTPLQNNIRELFNLIQFLDPDKDANILEEQYGTLTTENIRSLHDMIRPFFLRRTKAEVLPFLPPMVQIIIPVSMSVVQKKLYKSILGKNPQLIQAICKKQTGSLNKKIERHNLNNILVQLRKCLCHPFIYNRAIEEMTSDPIVAFQRLVEASGKLRLLNVMLPKLQERGHRVLIFSQFLENLDVVEDFLSGLQLRYCRLDGNLTSRQKQHQIDQFNAPNSPFFAFLLSTRSGGVGINLATADTVIIMDPDFNPKQDLQALSRAHRIGQKNTVLVFHLTTRGSVEEKIMEMGKKKLALDHVLIERMEADEDQEDLESILRHGAQALFNDDKSLDIHYDSDSINKLLDRSQAVKVEKIASDTPASSTDQPQFSFARVWQNDSGTLEEVTETEETPVDATVWEEILRERERDAKEEEYRKAEGLGRGKRKRAAVNYQTIREDDDANERGAMISSPVKARKAGDSDVEFQQEEEAAQSDTTSNAIENAMDIQQPTPTQSKSLSFKRVHNPPPEPPLGLDGTMDFPARCIACNQHHLLGHCALKKVGHEYCPLCGLAHFGRNRNCSHFRSETQVRRMLDALSRSNENPDHVRLAKKYLQGTLGHLAAQARIQAQKEADLLVPRISLAPRSQHIEWPAQPPPAAIVQPPRNDPMIIDLT